jgi:hypothetical protein
LLPAIDLGIFVTTILLSIVTVEVTPVGKDADVKVEGMVKFFGVQSSIKKPMVGANVGSTWGLMVVSTGGGGGDGVIFLSQAVNKNIIEINLLNNLILSLVIMIVLSFLIQSLDEDGAEDLKAKEVAGNFFV